MNRLTFASVALAALLAACGDSFTKIGCDPALSSCSLECTKGTCSGSCGPSCSGTCSGGSTCTVTAGVSASLSCIGGATCNFTIAGGNVGCTGATCHVACTGTCHVDCTSGSTCDLKCGANPATVISAGAVGNC